MLDNKILIRDGRKMKELPVTSRKQGFCGVGLLGAFVGVCTGFTYSN